MSQFYTKVQIDQIATVVGNEIKQTKASAPTPATSYNSFIDAFNLALNGTSTELPSMLLPNTSEVIIGSRSGTKNFKYSISVYGSTYNDSGLDLKDFWMANRSEFSSPARDLFIDQDPESNGMVFTSNSYDTEMHVILIPVLGSPTDYDFVVGQGSSFNGRIEFKISPNMNAS